MIWTGTRPFQSQDTTPSQLVTFAQMQAQLKMDSTDEESYISDLIDAASEFAETALDASLLTRTITATFYAQPPSYHPRTPFGQPYKLALPRGPVQSITSVVDANGQTVTQYTRSGEGLTDYLTINQTYTAPVTVTFVAGYGSTVLSVPADIRLAIRSHVASLWRTRTSVAETELLPVPHSLEDFYRLKKRGVCVG